MKFKIQFEIGAYTFELYNDRGASIYDLNEAYEEALRQFPQDNWIVYNGKESLEKE